MRSHWRRPNRSAGIDPSSHPSSSNRLRSIEHGGFDALIGAAATEISTHRLHDFGFGRLGHFFQEPDGGHDLPRLAVAALGYVMLRPGRKRGLPNRIRADRLEIVITGCVPTADTGIEHERP